MCICHIGGTLWIFIYLYNRIHVVYCKKSVIVNTIKKGEVAGEERDKLGYQRKLMKNKNHANTDEGRKSEVEEVNGKINQERKLELGKDKAIGTEPSQVNNDSPDSGFFNYVSKSINSESSNNYWLRPVYYLLLFQLF